MEGWKIGMSHLTRITTSNTKKGQANTGPQKGTVDVGNSKVNNVGPMVFLATCHRKGF